jgi:hypothetical protein
MLSCYLLDVDLLIKLIYSLQLVMIPTINACHKPLARDIPIEATMPVAFNFV